MIDYPAFRFGPDESSVVVLSAEEDAKLDEGWSDQVHENFDPKTAPTYPSVYLIKPTEPEKRKPGRPKKVA